MHKLHMLTAVVLASMIVALGAVSGLGLFPRLGSAATATASTPMAASAVSVITFDDSAAETILPSPGVVAVASTAQE